MRLLVNTVIAPFSIALMTKTGDRYDAVLPEGSVSEMIIEKTQGLCAQHNCDLNTIEEIVYINGPGPYTALRIGACMVKTIAQLYSSEIISISSLKALIPLSIPKNELIISMMPARKQEMHLQLFSIQNTGIHEISECVVLNLDALRSFLLRFEAPIHVVLPDALSAHTQIDSPIIHYHERAFDSKELLNTYSSYNQSPQSWRRISVSYSPLPVVS
jgi:tRNA threonylcarbamoyl adenosine modification protein YeaZ